MPSTSSMGSNSSDGKKVRFSQSLDFHIPDFSYDDEGSDVFEQA